MYIDLPNIADGTPEEQLSQIRSYIYRLNEQLNAALGEINTDMKGYTGEIITSSGEKLTVENGRIKSKE